MKKIVIYHKYIPKLGGIESAVYNLARGLDSKGYHVTIAYERAESSESLFGYARVSDVRKVLADDVIDCDVCLIASNHALPVQIVAKKYLQWIHSDYDKYNLDLLNKGKVEYVAVSDWARQVILNREGVDSDVIYNLIGDDYIVDKSPRLKLVTNSRVSPEKGFGRMLDLAKVLKEKGVRFKWIIYGDNTPRPSEYVEWVDRFRDIPEVHFVGYKRDIKIGLEDVDYLVQLSDWEGCPLSVLEALRNNIPCIVADWGGVKELIQNGKNGYILPMETKSYARYVDKIVNKIPEFEYKPLSTIEDWVKIMESKK